MAFPALRLPSSSSSSTALRQSTNPIKASVQLMSQNTLHFQKQRVQFPNWVSRISSNSLNFLLSGSLALTLSLSGVGFAEAKPGVNKPELLPKEFTTVIDVAGFLSDGQEVVVMNEILVSCSRLLPTPRLADRWYSVYCISSGNNNCVQEKRIAQEIAALEKDTGYKLRVLAQNYPDTPGLAIKDFWNVDDNTIVFVADPTFGNILNFNVGATVDLDIPRSFWSRLAGKYGNIFYWKEKGEDASIEAAVMAVSTCL